MLLTPEHTHQRYETRILASLCVTLLLLIGLIQLWPSGPAADASVSLYDARGDDVIQIEEIQPTSQSLEKRPPPPAPLPPVVYPDDAVIEEEPLEFTDANLLVEDPGEDAERREGADEATAAPRPDTNARLLRYVEPDYTRAARKENVRARIVVEVRVDSQGRVQDAAILKRMLLDDKGNPTETVDALGYGLEEAALSAARRCLFRPARANGEAVATRTTLTISFGS